MSFVSGRPFYEDADPPRPGLTRWLVPGSLKRHRMGLVGASLGSPRPSSCWRRKAALGTGSFTPPASLTSLRTPMPARCRRALCGFRIGSRLGKLRVGSGAWAEKRARPAGLSCCSAGGRVLPHAPLAVGSAGAARRRLFFSEACPRCAYVLLCWFARNASAVRLKGSLRVMRSHLPFASTQFLVHSK